MTVSLQVTTREKGARKKLQTEDKLPAVVYGPKQESISLAVNRREFEKVFQEAGESSIVSLEGLDEPIEVLVQAVEFHPTKPEILHIDFYAIEVTIDNEAEEIVASAQGAREEEPEPEEAEEVDMEAIAVEEKGKGEEEEGGEAETKE